MSVINFPGGSGPRIDHGLIERATRLKQRLVEFVTRGPMADRHGEVLDEQGVESLTFQEFIDFTDWFIFEWESDDGETVLDEFADSADDLDETDLEIVDGWQEAITDLFDVVDVRPDCFMIADVEGNRFCAVPTGVAMEEMAIEPGMSVSTRIVPVGEIYLLSGIQEFYKSRDEATRMLVEEMEDEIDRWLYDAFVAHFGSDETVLSPSEVNERLEEFAQEAIRDFKPEGADATIGELLGTGSEMPRFFGALEVDYEKGENIVVLVDPSEGPALIYGYDIVRDYVASGEGDRGRSRAKLLEILEDGTVPPFVVRRLAALSPSNFQSLVADALDEPDFDVELDLEDLIDDFKGGYDEDLGEMLAGDESEIVFPDDLDDVRDALSEELPERSIAAAARDFLVDLGTSLKSETIEAHALSVNMLVHFSASDERSTIDDLDEEMLFDFLSVWYPRSWGQPSASNAKQLLSSMGKFTAWLDKTHGTSVGHDYKKIVFPALKDDLPRIAKAERDIVRTISLPSLDDALGELDAEDPSSLGRALGVLLGSPNDADAVRGTFAIVTIDGDTALARKRAGDFEGEEEDETIYKIALPPEAAEALRPGDVLLAALSPGDKRWSITALLAIYPPAAVR